jgi:hypothetical protein
MQCHHRWSLSRKGLAGIVFWLGVSEDVEVGVAVVPHEHDDSADDA